MILIVDMNSKMHSLGCLEFVLPIVRVISSMKDMEPYNIVHYSEISSDMLESVDKAILSGTPIMDLDSLEHVHEFSWICDMGTPMLGICAGMQFLCLLFGSRLIPCLEIGMTEIETILENLLFSLTFNAYNLHRFAVEPSPEFDILARSQHCVQAVRHRNKELIGVLFHPEVRNQEIIERFIQLI